MRGTWIRLESSTLLMIRVICWITCTGYLPTEVSPESITASAPSITEFPTSFTSARVGVRLEIILSIIWVAMITGMWCDLALRTNSFWIRGTSSAGISTPRSPRATIIPLQAAIILSMFTKASGFSILAMIGIS